MTTIFTRRVLEGRNHDTILVLCFPNRNNRGTLSATTAHITAVFVAYAPRNQFHGRSSFFGSGEFGSHFVA